MLKINILRVCQIRNIERPFSFFKNHGFSTSAATRIASGNLNGLALDSFEKVCLALNCTPNDLLEWVPSKNVNLSPNHSLNALKRNEAILASFTQLVKDASFDKIEKIQEIIQKELAVKS
jgi:DNA-binding Xre family transcriptional regulator